MFDFVKVNIDSPEVDPINKDGVRYYPIPGADKYYPSVTSITSFKNAAFFAGWRKKIGEDEANRITARATQRGTTFHSITEDYIKGELDLNMYLENNPLAVRMFQSAKDTLNRIDNIHCLETFLYSHYLGLAGRVDCIAEFDGELAVIDFKTSKKPKPRDWIEHYFVQCMAYGCMLYELTGISVKKLVIIMACENGECVIYEEYDKAKYIKLLGKYIRKFVNDKLELYGTQ